MVVVRDYACSAQINTRVGHALSVIPKQQRPPTLLDWQGLDCEIFRLAFLALEIDFGQVLCFLCLNTSNLQLRLQLI